MDEDDEDFEDLEDEDEDAFDDVCFSQSLYTTASLILAEESDSDVELSARRPPKRVAASSSVGSNVNPEECKQQ